MLVDGHDVLICATVAVAERFLEPWAVDDGSAYGFDATGRRLSFRVVRPSRSGLALRFLGQANGPVRIALAEEEASGRDELKASLRDYLRATAPAEHVDGLSIIELIEVARRKAEVR